MRELIEVIILCGAAVIITSIATIFIVLLYKVFKGELQ